MATQQKLHPSTGVQVERGIDGRTGPGQRLAKALLERDELIHRQIGIEHTIAERDEAKEILLVLEKPRHRVDIAAQSGV